MSALTDVVQSNPPAGIRIVARAIMLFLVAFVAWALFAQFEEVSIAVGEVVPQGQVKVVQHLEGGIIESIFVQEGDTVKAGDPLLQLDLSASSSREQELTVTLDGFILRRARLDAEASGSDLVFPADVASRRPDTVRSEQLAFETRRLELESTLSGLGDQIQQRELDIKQLETERGSKANDLGLAREELAISASLLVDELTSKVDHLSIQREVEQLEGEIASIGSAIARAKSTLSEAKEKLREAGLNFRRTALDELGKVQLAIDQTRQELGKATAQSRRTEINSPIDGVVKGVRYHTIGAVVSPGEPVMEIVPSNENLVIEAKLRPNDIGYVSPGQAAVVKISTYDFARYGGLEATIILVSADSTTTDDGATFFRVVAQTDKNYLGASPGDLPITAGMEATVDIHTGKRSVMHYLLKPVLKLRSEAFRER
ncbi:MAG: HlyD family type I secretion periplasmic adaptor subunit [Alphaproteobacteria bacterium]|nr:HlyD family type I secretion periplasmic adaptor subunit [Alphaproteobacteria bacterium]